LARFCRSTTSCIFFNSREFLSLCSASFLGDEEFAAPLLSFFHKEKGKEDMTPFTWQNKSYITFPHWELAFLLLASHKGIFWFGEKLILNQENSSLFDWLAIIRMNEGVDREDLGQIRLHLLIKAFSLLEQERFLTSSTCDVSEREVFFFVFIILFLRSGMGWEKKNKLMH